MVDDHILTEAELQTALETLPWLGGPRRLAAAKNTSTPGWPHTLLLANTIGIP